MQKVNEQYFKHLCVYKSGIKYKLCRFCHFNSLVFSQNENYTVGTRNFNIFNKIASVYKLNQKSRSWKSPKKFPLEFEFYFRLVEPQYCAKVKRLKRTFLVSLFILFFCILYYKYVA